jgi:uncharacterized membrane protein
MSDLNTEITPSEASPQIAVILRNRILTGLLLVIPIIVTLWVVTKTYGLATNWALEWICRQPFSNFMRVDGNFPFWFDPGIRLVTLILLLIGLFLIGDLARYTFFRRGLKSFEHLLLQLPLIKIIYMTCKQIVEAVSKPGGGMFRQVVLFEHPRPGIWALGFVTNEDTGPAGFSGRIGHDVYTVFLPTTPNPTSGFLLFIPKEDCLLLEISITDAMRLVISGGTIHPESLLPSLPETPGLEDGGAADGTGGSGL